MDDDVVAVVVVAQLVIFVALLVMKQWFGAFAELVAIYIVIKAPAQ